MTILSERGRDRCHCRVAHLVGDSVGFRRLANVTLISLTEAISLKRVKDRYGETRGGLLARHLQRPSVGYGSGTTGICYPIYGGIITPFMG